MKVCLPSALIFKRANGKVSPCLAQTTEFSGVMFYCSICCSLMLSERICVSKAVAVYINSEVLSGTAGLQRHRSLGKMYQTLPHKNKKWKAQESLSCACCQLQAAGQKWGNGLGGLRAASRKGWEIQIQPWCPQTCPRNVGGTHIPMSPGDGWCGSG